MSYIVHYIYIYLKCYILDIIYLLWGAFSQKLTYNYLNFVCITIFYI